MMMNVMTMATTHSTDAAAMTEARGSLDFSLISAFGGLSSPELFVALVVAVVVGREGVRLVDGLVDVRALVEVLAVVGGRVTSAVFREVYLVVSADVRAVVKVVAVVWGRVMAAVVFGVYLVVPGGVRAVVNVLLAVRGRLVIVDAVEGPLLVIVVGVIVVVASSEIVVTGRLQQQKY